MEIFAFCTAHADILKMAKAKRGKLYLSTGLWKSISGLEGSSAEDAQSRLGTGVLCSPVLLLYAHTLFAAGGGPVDLSYCSVCFHLARSYRAAVFSLCASKPPLRSWNNGNKGDPLQVKGGDLYNNNRLLHWLSLLTNLYLSFKDHSFKLVNEDDSTSNGNKPVASTPVPGSPWCVVWTGDDRVFFFNPTMQLSVWEKPVDLKHRGDINRIIEDPPHKRKLEAAANKCVSSCPGDENDDLSIKTKRNKTEDSQAAEQGKAETEEKKEETSAPQITPPLEERITHFRDMLLERGVSAFSTWEKELHKIVFDPRYLLLNSEERKQIFEQFVKTRIREEYKEKKNKLLLAKEEFKKLLEESKLSPRTTFKEFAEKYGRDQRFRLVQKKKDQEHFFNQFILILKKRDKENRIRLRKMR
uniref:Transcription elongation regulator 1-like protein n=1 Tax=Accipiter nisus TaxID=211598 RepID=A0A8B9LZG4_9AVES